MQRDRERSSGRPPAPERMRDLMARGQYVGRDGKESGCTGRGPTMHASLDRYLVHPSSSMFTTCQPPPHRQHRLLPCCAWRRLPHGKTKRNNTKHPPTAPSPPAWPAAPPCCPGPSACRQKPSWAPPPPPARSRAASRRPRSTGGFEGAAKCDAGEGVLWAAAATSRSHAASHRPRSAGRGW